MEENKLVLSTDINVITAEINSYKQIAGQSIFEIGRRLKHVKEHDLVHGEWKPFLESIDMSKSQADRFIKVFSEYEMNKLPNVGNIGFVVMYEIATFPEEQREQQHTIPSTGKSKTVDEMTVKELREVKAELKRKQEENQRLEEQVKELKTAPVKTQTITNTIDNTDYERLDKLERELQKEKEDKKNLNQKIFTLESAKYDYEQKIRDIEKEAKSEQAEIERLKRQKEKLELEAHISISELQIGIHKFIEEYSPSVFLQGAVASSTFMMRDDLLDSVVALEEFTVKLRELLNSKIVGSGNRDSGNKTNNKNNVIDIN